MIRIIYTWEVEPENSELFIDTWRSTTNKIHEEIEGARGSFMLRSDEDARKIKTIARWNSINDWEKFWHGSNHNQMQSMHDLGKRVSVEVFREIDDYTS